MSRSLATDPAWLSQESLGHVHARTRRFRVSVHSDSFQSRQTRAAHSGKDEDSCGISLIDAYVAQLPLWWTRFFRTLSQENQQISYGGRGAFSWLPVLRFGSQIEQPNLLWLTLLSDRGWPCASASVTNPFDN